MLESLYQPVTADNPQLGIGGVTLYSFHRLRGHGWLISKGLVRSLFGAENKRTAFMCSEGLFWRCHRRLVSDYLLVKGITVQHIMPSGELHAHTLTTGARVMKGELAYPKSVANQPRSLFD